MDEPISERSETVDIMIYALAHAILRATDAVAEGHQSEETLPTAPDLARELGFKLDKAKKKLRWLKQQALLQVVGMSPKRYRIDRYAWDALDPEHPLLCEPPVSNGNHSQGTR